MNTTPVPETNGKAMPVKRKKAAGARRKSAARRAGAGPAAMATRYADTAARFVKRSSRNAAGSAAQALSAAADYVPDRRRLQAVAEENPYLLGAIGLGIGIAVGMMLPTLGTPNRSRRKSR
jgi:hypothetical protein